MKTVTEILNDFGNSSVNDIRSNIKRAGKNVTGETSAAITSEMITPDRVQVSGPSYVYTLEDGRGPRRGTTKSEFPSKLRTWLIKRGNYKNFGNTIEQATRSLQFLINKRGTKLWREGGRKDILTPVVDDPRRYERLTKDIAEAQLNKTISEIDKSIDA